MSIKDIEENDVYCCSDNCVQSCNPGTQDDKHCNSLCENVENVVVAKSLALKIQDTFSIVSAKSMQHIRSDDDEDSKSRYSGGR